MESTHPSHLRPLLALRHFGLALFCSQSRVTGDSSHPGLILLRLRRGPALGSHSSLVPSNEHRVAAVAPRPALQVPLSQNYVRGPLINFPLSQSNKDAVHVLDSCLEPEGLLKKRLADPGVASCQQVRKSLALLLTITSQRVPCHFKSLNNQLGWRGAPP